MPREPRTYRLTADLVATSVGLGVMCLAAEGIGRTFRLHARRPGPEQNQRAWRLDDGSIAWRSDLPSGAAHVIAPVPAEPTLIRVDISGPLEQRAGYHDPCAGWSDGHDAVADRLCAAFEVGDVLLVIDTPGGAVAGLEQAVERAQAAKAKHGRYCTVFANEQIASAGVWWAFALADEVFVPVRGAVGSIGARGGHKSIAGALAKEGIEVTYFADPPDKIAFAPELPLSPVAMARGNRDVKATADAFRAAVCASKIGVRHGLTPEALIEMGADMFTGELAVAAGLADGVATEAEVVAYALALAEQGSESKSSGAPARARGGTMKTITTTTAARQRAEGDPPADPETPAAEHDEDMPPSSRPLPKCGGCGASAGAAAKYCSACGAKLAAEEPAEPPAASEDEPAEEPEAEGPPASPAEASTHVALPARQPADASFARVLGLPESASLPAQRTAAIDLRQVFDHAAAITGQRTAAGILGGLTALADDAAASGRLRAERDALQEKQQREERHRLAHRLVALGVAGHERGKVFLDSVDASGARKLDASGRPLVKLAPVYAEMRLDTLKGLVEGYERNAPKRDPFEPAAQLAEAVNKGATTALDLAARITRAKQHPKVIEMSRRPGQTISIDKLAAAFVASDFDL